MLRRPRHHGATPVVHGHPVDADIWELADEIDADPGEVLVSKGRPVGHAFVVRAGSADVVSGEGRAVLGPGARFDTEDASRVVIARSPMRLLVVDVARATAMLGLDRTKHDERETR
jgi:hypothetical protein